MMPPLRTLLWSLLPPTVLGAILVAPVCFDVVRETDVGWHLALGRLVAQEGIPFRNALSWTVPDEPWYATSWAFGLVAYLLTDSLGVFGLQLWTFVLASLTLALVGLAALAADRRGPWLVPLLALMLVPRITERPHLVSWAVLAGVLAFALHAQNRDRAEPGAGWKLRLLAVPLIAVGSNFHAGAVFAAVALSLFCAEALIRHRSLREPGIALAGLVALIANPGWTFNVTYALEHFGVQRVIRLAEFESPTLARAWMFYVLVAIALVVGWMQRRERPVLLLLVVVFAGLGMYALRLVYKAEIVAIPILAFGLAQLRTTHSARAALMTVAALTLAVGGLRLRFYDGLELAPAFDTRTLPVGAAAFIRDHGLDGRMYNGFRDGGHLAWEVSGLGIYQDARVQAYPPAFFARQQQAEGSPEAFQAFLRAQDVEWALASRVKEPLAGHGLVAGPEWALVYWDHASEIFVRRDVERLEEIRTGFEYRCFDPYAPLLRELSRRDRSGLEACEAEVDRFERNAPGDPFAALVRCAIEARTRRNGAEATCAQAASRAPDERTRALVGRMASLPPAD